MGGISTINTTRRKLPRWPLDAIAQKLLGSRYELSVAFVGETRARDANRKTRGKTYAPNVLALPLEKAAGEIILCPSVIKRQAPKFEMSYRTFMAYLFIHGLLHLKGMDHGATMERKEREALEAFGFH